MIFQAAYFIMLLNDWCLIELLVLNGTTWKYISMCKQIINK